MSSRLIIILIKKVIINLAWSGKEVVTRQLNGILRQFTFCLYFELVNKLVIGIFFPKSGCCFGLTCSNLWHKILEIMIMLMKTGLESNKKNAVAFYDLMFNQCKPEMAIQQYAGDEYIQHNPHVGDGKQAFIEYFNRMAAEYPGKRVYFKRVLAEDDYVVLHCLQEWPGDHNYAGIDIFRFDQNGKVIEHWDVLQVIPDKSKNDNTMF